MNARKVVTVVCCGIAALAFVPLAYAAPITGGTGPGGIGTTDGSSNLILWVNAEQGISQDDAVGRVSDWADLSGNGHYAEQTNTTVQPNYVSSSMNGRPAVQVVEADGLRMSFPTMSNAAGNYTFFFAVDPGSNPDFAYMFDTTGARLLLAYGANLGGHTDDLAVLTGSDWVYTNSNADETPQIDTFVLQPSNQTSIHRNGTALAIASGANDYTQTALSNNAGFPSPGFSNFTGDYSELVIFNTAVSGVEQTLVENYLAARYAIAIGNNRYSGDTLHGYEEDVFGIGNDGTSSVTNSGSHGFGIEADGGSLGANEWVLAGHDQPTNSLTTNDLAGAASQRWSRDWYVDKTGQVDATLSFDFSDAGLSVPDDVEGFALLFRSGAGGSFANITSLALSTIVSGDTISFALLDANLATGFYTLGMFLPVPEPSTLVLAGLGMMALTGRVRRKR